MSDIQLGISQSRGYENFEIKGMQEFMGRQIPVVCGGFGKGQKVVLAKTVAEIHGEEVKATNQRINMNRNRFKDGVDLIDLKVVNLVDHNLLKEFGFTQMQISKANNIYLLSERGYAKLIKIMDSDLAWEIHDKLMDEYFNLRQECSNPYAHLSKELQAIIQIDIKQQELEKGQKELNKRMDIFEENACLTPGEYGMISQKINNKVCSIIKERGLTLSRKQRSELYKSINRDIKVITGVQTRSQLRQKHLEPVLDLIYRWEPSLATMMKVNQMSLAI